MNTIRQFSLSFLLFYLEQKYGESGFWLFFHYFNQQYEAKQCSTESNI